MPNMLSFWNKVIISYKMNVESAKYVFCGECISNLQPPDETWTKV